MLKHFYLVIFLLQTSPALWANCDAILESFAEENTPTISFLSLLHYMVEKQYMTVDQYQAFMLSVSRGEPRLPLSRKELSSSSSIGRLGQIFSYYLIHWQDHPEYLEKGTILKIGRKNLLKWKAEKLQKTKANKATKNPFTSMEFVTVKAGKLRLGPEKKGREVELKQDIEVQKYLVTQLMWVELMGKNPSTFTRGDESISIEAVRLQPNHPVETVTWYSVLAYANKLSEKHGYQPVYDFSGVTKFDGSFEKGTYRVLKGEIKINETNGYRLPYHSEWEYIARGGTTSKFSFGDDESLLDDYAWFSDNSNDETHAVGEKKPNPFGLYDIHGNVLEWTGDLAAESEKDGLRRLYGGSWNDFNENLPTDSYFVSYPNRYSYVGFRLVRSKL